MSAIAPDERDAGLMPRGADGSLSKYPQLIGYNRQRYARSPQQLRGIHRMLIADEHVTAESMLKLGSLRSCDDGAMHIETEAHLAATLDRMLLCWLQEVWPGDASQEDTLVVFLGRGAEAVRRLSRFLHEQPLPNLGVAAWRHWVPGSDPFAVADTLLPERFIITGIRRILVFDDVISSGVTMRALHERNAWRFPNAEWVAATWVIQEPQSKSKSGLSGYTHVFAAEVLPRPESGRKWPINSISTLRENPELAAEYATRHIHELDRQLFLEAIGKRELFPA